MFFIIILSLHNLRPTFFFGPILAIAKCHFTFRRLPRWATTAPETSKWNTKAMNFRCCTLMQVIIWNPYQLQMSKYSSARTYLLQLSFLAPIKGRNSTSEQLEHLKPRFEILKLWMCYFVRTLKSSFGTIIDFNHAQTHAPVHIWAHYNFTSRRLWSGATRLPEILIRNTKAMNLLFCTHIEVIIWNPHWVQPFINSCPFAYLNAL